jgi:molecular chaperone DnaK
MLLLDVIPLSLGIETLGGAVAKLIMANSTIPARATEMFTTYVDGQTSIKVHVLQGERELVRDCRSLGEFDLRGIPAMPSGLPKVRVTFLVDANGILNVSAVEERSGKAAHIQIVPNHGLTRQEVAAMEAASLHYARQDMTEHQRIDLRNQAQMDLRNIERQLARVGAEADSGYRQEIMEKMAAARRLAEDPAADVRALQQALIAMDQATVHLAELAIKKALNEDAPEREQ